MSLITIYTKPGCHLCEEALLSLRALQQELHFSLRVFDITTDEAIHRAYFERIPVVTLDEQELFEYFIDERILRERLAFTGHHPPEGGS